MAGLSNLIADKSTVETTAPPWLTSAQESSIGRAGTAADNTPAPSQTTGQLSVNTLNNPNNAFAQGQAPLDTIAQGAANPWLIDAEGNATPNTSTPMGALFNAQRNYFNQLLPNVAAPVDAQSIGSGNFGSLRGLTASRKAIGDAYNQLVTQQNQAALQNQQYGVQAGAALGNLGQLQNQAQLETAKWQQAAPFAAATGYSNVLGNIKNTPQTQISQTQLSPLSQIESISKLIGSIAGSPGGVSALSSLGVPQSIINALSANNANLDPTPRPGETQAAANARVAAARQAGSGNLLGAVTGWIGRGARSVFDRITGGGGNVDFPSYNTPEQNQPVAPEDFDAPEYNQPPTAPESPPSDWVEVPPEWGDQAYWTTPEEDYYGP